MLKELSEKIDYCFGADSVEGIFPPQIKTK